MYLFPDHLWAPQRRGLEETMKLVSDGKHVCYYGPTGSGKTVVAFELMNWALSLGMKSIFYLNRKLLIDQTVKRAKEAGMPIGVRAAGFEDEYDWSAPCQIASADTEWSRVHKRNIWEPFRAHLVIIDELHLQKQDKMKAIMDGHRARGAVSVGMTATPIGVSHMCDELVVSGTLAEYRACKALVPAIVKSIEQPDMSKVKRNATGEYIMDGEKKRIYTQSIVGNVLKYWKEHNPDGRATFLYAPGVPESRWFTEQFMAAGIPWAHIDATDAVLDGKQIKLTRGAWQEILGRMKDGRLRGISNRFKCLDMDTEVLTRRGWVGAIQYLSDDPCEVASLDLTTNKIAWSVPSRATLQAGEDFCEIKNLSVDVRVTHDHNLVLKSNCNRCRNWKLMPAEQASNRLGAFRIPVAGMEDVPGLSLCDSQVAFLGWFLTDGHLSEDGRVTICQSTSQPAHIHQHIRDTLDGCGFKWTSGKYEARIGDTVYEPAVHYRVPRRELERTGMTRYLDKDFHPDLFQLNRRQLELLLVAINYGDGSKPSNPTWQQKTLEINKGNATFLSRLQAVCVVRGMRANFHADDHCHRLYVTPGRDYAVVRGATQDDPEGVHRVRIVRTMCDPEPVWCLTTQFDTLVTRRNGKAAIVGNCREGIDLPFAYHALLATPIGSLASYLQTIGRILRYSPETPDHVIVSDFGGCYWQHGSPNHDRDWRSWWNLSEATVSGMHLNNIKERKEPEPIRCPMCGTERLRGSKCVNPECGFEHQKSVREVLMENGQLKTREGHLVRERNRKEKNDTQALWSGLVHGHLRKVKAGKSDGVTFAQMEAWFFRQHHYYPSRNLKMMPKNDWDWSNKIHLVGVENLT